MQLLNMLYNRIYLFVLNKGSGGEVIIYDGVISDPTTDMVTTGAAQYALNNCDGITVDCVCPGPIRTAINEQIPEQDKQLFVSRRTALRRYAEPEEVAHGTLGLVLRASSFITGAIMVVDGGLTIRNA